MKNDLKYVLSILTDYMDSFENSNIFLYGEDKDNIIKENINKIKKKYKV